MSIENFKCVYCESDQGSKQFSTKDVFGDEFDLVYCDRCQTINLHPPPTAQQLNRAYDRDYYGAGSRKFNPLIEQLLLRSKIRRAKTIAQIVKSGKILDIGCADGSFLSQFNRFGNFELEGIELDEHAALRAAKNRDIHLRIGTLRDFHLEPCSYAAITLNHVFEHLSDPKYTLQKAKELLLPCGVLMIAIPNIESTQARYFEGDWFHLDPPRHLFFMTKSRLTSELNDLGFNLVKERFMNVEYNPYGFQQSILNRVSSQREVLYEHLKGNTHLVKAKPHQVWLQRLFVGSSLPLFIITDLLASRAKKTATMELYYQKQD